MFNVAIDDLAVKPYKTMQKFNSMNLMEAVKVLIL